MICKGIIAPKTEAAIKTLSSLCRKEITKEIAAKTLSIPEDEVDALMEGFYWNPIPDMQEMRIDNQTYNKPEAFEEIFEEYINLTDIKRLSNKRIDAIIEKLDDLVSTFPCELFPELYATHFEWDDSTRYVINYVTGSDRIKFIKQLRDEFWKIYSIKMDTIRSMVVMQAEFTSELIKVDQNLEEMRSKIMAKYDATHNNERLLMAQVMKDVLGAQLEENRSTK